MPTSKPPLRLRWLEQEGSRYVTQRLVARVLHDLAVVVGVDVL
jgi:hypothetical protein